VLNEGFYLMVFPKECAFASPNDSDALYIKDNALITDTPSVWVFAEVINNSTKIFRNVNVIITFYDNEGEIINALSKKVWLEYILPYRRAPVAASITDEEALRFNRYDVKIENYQVEQIEIEKNLIVNVESALLSENNVTIVCTVFNNGTTPMKDLVVNAIFYYEHGIRCTEGFSVKLTEPLNKGAVTEPIYINSIFVNSNLEKVACIVTAEARGSSDTQETIYYAIDEEVLFWLKGEQRLIHYAYVDGKLFEIETYSNSSIHDLNFSKTSKKITFVASGIVQETAGFCNVTIPIELLNGPYTIRINDLTILSGYNPETNGTHNFVYITYNHDSTPVIVEIFGPQENDFRLTIIIIIILCVFAVAILGVITKKKLKRTHRRRATKIR
jgi:hypothetical protein